MHFTDILTKYKNLQIKKIRIIIFQKLSLFLYKSWFLQFHFKSAKIYISLHIFTYKTVTFRDAPDLHEDFKLIESYLIFLITLRWQMTFFEGWFLPLNFLWLFANLKSWFLHWKNYFSVILNELLVLKLFQLSNGDVILFVVCLQQYKLYIVHYSINVLT